jgi:general nucleoside transport system permease protein
MAVPLMQPETSEQRPPAATRFRRWASAFALSLARPVVAILFAFIAGAIVILITWPDKTVDPFTNIYNAYTTLLNGAYGTPVNISNTLAQEFIPLTLASLSVAIAFRAGLFNIGAAGQLAAGGTVADMIGLTHQSWPAWLLVPTMILAGMAAGAALGGIVGFLKAWRGAHEVVTTIMLNWIVFWVSDYIINSPPFVTPSGTPETSALPTNAQLPALAALSNQWFHTNFDTFFYTVDVSIFLVIIAVVIYWFIISRTTFGYELRVVGQNPQAARYAGIPIKRTILQVMLIAGAFGGLAGALNLMGQPGYNLGAGVYSMLQTGFDAIAVALLGNTSALGVVIASLFLGGLRSGTTEMQAIAHVDPNLVLIIEALVLFFIAAEFIPVIRRHLPRWMRSRPAPTLLPIAYAQAGPMTTIKTDTSVVEDADMDVESAGFTEDAGEQPPGDRNLAPGKEQ